MSQYTTGKVFIQLERSYLLQGGFDTNQVRSSKILPANIDYGSGSIGIEYQYLNTDYRYNPRKGNDISFTGWLGLKKINSNNDILNLKDPAAPEFNFKSLYDSLSGQNYQLHARLVASHYFPSGKRSVLKTSASLGIVQSKNLFRRS